MLIFALIANTLFDPMIQFLNKNSLYFYSLFLLIRRKYKPKRRMNSRRIDKNAK